MLSSSSGWAVAYGDLSFTPTGFWHGSKVEAGRQCDYIWFEMCIDGYPGEIK